MIGIRVAYVDMHKVIVVVLCRVQINVEVTQGSVLHFQTVLPSTTYYRILSA